jgi:hypothetical protein
MFNQEELKEIQPATLITIKNGLERVKSDCGFFSANDQKLLNSVTSELSERRERKVVDNIKFALNL